MVSKEMACLPQHFGRAEGVEDTVWTQLQVEFGAASVRSNCFIHITSKKFAHDSISMSMLRLSYAQVRSFGGHVKANSSSKFDRFEALPPLG